MEEYVLTNPKLLSLHRVIVNKFEIIESQVACVPSWYDNVVVIQYYILLPKSID